VAIAAGAGARVRTGALPCPREGAKVVTTDILSCEEIRAKVQGTGGEALAVPGDVTSEQSTKAMAIQTLQRFGRIDILVNNAALYERIGTPPAVVSCVVPEF
jgi:NAD(P)-dependent dehydrogenase (short-subunit alcohol dehydrogenase family)